jgi:hypothetical protein
VTSSVDSVIIMVTRDVEGGRRVTTSSEKMRPFTPACLRRNLRSYRFGPAERGGAQPDLLWCGAMVPENTPVLVCARQSMLHGAFGSTYDTTVYPNSLQKSIEIHGYLLLAPNAVNPNNVNDTTSKSPLWNCLGQVEPPLPLCFTAQDDVGYLAALHAELILREFTSRECPMAAA